MRNAGSEEQEAKRARRIGEWLEAVAAGRGSEGVEGGRLTHINIRMPTEEEPSTLLILRAAGAKGKVIAFVGAYGVVDALLAWRARCQAGSMKWREDVPFDAR